MLNFINVVIRGKKKNIKIMENDTKNEILFHKNFYFPYSKIIKSIRIGGWTKEIIERKRKEKEKEKENITKTELNSSEAQISMSFLFTIPSKEKKSKAEESSILEVYINSFYL